MIEGLRTGEVAGILRCTPANVARLCRAGKLRAYKTDGGNGIWIIIKSSLEEYLGRPLEQPKPPDSNLIDQLFRDGKIAELMHG